MQFKSKVQLKGYKGSWSNAGGPAVGGEDLANIEERLLWELEVHTAALRRAIKRDRGGEKVDLWDYRKCWWVAWHRLDNFHRNQADRH